MSAARWKLGAIDAVCDFMRKRGVTPDDLLGIGGEDLNSKSPTKAEKAHRVAKCWALMAQLSVSYENLAQAAADNPTKPPSRPRGEGHSLQVLEIAGVSEVASSDTEANEINDLADLAPVGDPEINSAATQGGIDARA